MRRTKNVVMAACIAIGLAAMFTGCGTLCDLIDLPGCGVPEVKNHKAMFLYNNASLRMMNILSPAISRDAFKGFVNQMKNDGADMCYLYLINERDGGWTPYSFYNGNQIGGSINEGVLNEMKARCEYIRDKDMGIILWLRPDDSPNFVRVLEGGEEPESAPGLRFSTASVASQEQYQRDAIKHFGKYASGIVVGLELDEYYDAGTVNHYANQLQGLTKLPIGTHQKPDKSSFATLPTVDHCYFQYGFGKSTSHVKAMTEAIRRAVGKPVIASEYHKSSNSPQARALGDAAMAGGAYGTGNGRN